MTKQLEQAKPATSYELDPETYKIKAFLAGPSGSGKTQSIITLPGRKLLLDFDGRAETIAGTPEVSIIKIVEPDPRSPRAWSKVEDVLKEITSAFIKKEFPYDTIIADGLTMLGRYSMNWALLLDPGRGLGGAPAQQHYLPQMDTLSKWVLKLLALPLNIGVTGHLELFEDKKAGTTHLYPKITGKLRTEVANWFNETYYCYRVKGEKGGALVYYWMTAGAGRQEFFKSSMNSLGKYWKDPIKLEFGTDKPVGFQDLLGRRFKGGKAASEEVSEKRTKGEGNDNITAEVGKR